MKISLKFENTTLTATLLNNETTRDFVSLLPLTLTMADLFGREKFAHLPRALSEGGKRQKSFEVGDLIYWSPSSDVAFYYSHDGQSIPDPGIIVLGKIAAGVEALNVLGSVEVTIEPMADNRRD
ncbi:MAG: cyclophilin-like fold protein [Bythopirellula sp.]|nr:cyclophilin-like fold protein [Bythopirellula sp.]